MDNYLTIKGARVHNLRNIDVRIPKNKLVVITGLSGSGKSSLAFDTIYAEGQRRYVESLSSYARMFLGVVDKPDVESIEGLSPAIAIDQKSVSHNPRSTVGTVTEIYDYLRLLYARVGHPHCPDCGRPIQKQSTESIAKQVEKIAKTSKEIIILAPVITGKKGHHEETLRRIRTGGYRRVRVDGEIYPIMKTKELKLERYQKHSIEIALDRIDPSQTVGKSLFSRIFEMVEQALRIADGKLIIQTTTQNGKNQRLKTKDVLFSEHFACDNCHVNLSDIEPRSFSFNSPYGACEVCKGLGYKKEIDPELVIPNKGLSLAEGAIFALNKLGGGSTDSWTWQMIEKICVDNGIPLKTPVRNIEEEKMNLILYGLEGEKIRVKHQTKSGNSYEFDVKFEGIIPNLERRYHETKSDYIRKEIEKYMRLSKCPDCEGRKLKKEFLAVTVAGHPMYHVTQLPIERAQKWFNAIREDKDFFDKETQHVFDRVDSETSFDDKFFKKLSISDDDAYLTKTEKEIGRQILREIIKRLEFLSNVGLNYLTLDRSANTLSGGEAQRIRLATQIGAGLSGVLYVLDEPSIGLHQRDNDRLIGTLRELRDLGNTVIVVEHDEDTMLAADYIIDIGPGAGARGGKVVFEGTPDELKKSKELTGQYISGKKKIEIPKQLRSGLGRSLTIQGAEQNNLRNVDVEFPLGKMVVVTGVSGSGKSSLVNDTLAKALQQKVSRSRVIPGKHEKMIGVENVNKVIIIDQAPIGRTPRSNPATYTGVFTPIRELFANMPEAKVRGYKPGRFSFNVKGGRCEACQGEGVNKIEMHFLPDVYVECPECRGKRYNQEALEITYKDKTISDVLNMNVEEAFEFFKPVPAIKNKLKTLKDVGLGYIHLGQNATTLSGGEAQRVKLSSELSKTSTSRTVYILDEPTTGLHFEDILQLLKVLHELADRGNTVIIIEHQLDVIKSADWVIDLGPEGGDKGGKIIATGTPREIAKEKKSYTGQYLKRYFE